MVNKMKLGGFSLIELMVVIAIVALLAAVAVPSYQQYIAKTNAIKKFVKPLNDYADRSVVFANVNNRFPNAVEMGLTPDDPGPDNDIMYGPSLGSPAPGIPVVSEPELFTFQVARSFQDDCVFGSFRAVLTGTPMIIDDLELSSFVIYASDSGSGAVSKKCFYEVLDGSGNVSPVDVGIEGCTNSQDPSHDVFLTNGNDCP